MLMGLGSHNTSVVAPSAAVPADVVVGVVINWHSNDCLLLRLHQKSTLGYRKYTRG